MDAVRELFDLPYGNALFAERSRAATIKSYAGSEPGRSKEEALLPEAGLFAGAVATGKNLKSQLL